MHDDDARRRFELVRERARREQERETWRLQREQVQQDMGLGYLVFCARQHARLGLKALADRIGSPKSTVSKWERGRRVPSLSALGLIAAVTDLDLMIGLRDRRNGDFLAFGKVFGEAPVIELHLEHDRYATTWLRPAKWRQAVWDDLARPPGSPRGPRAAPDY